MQIHANGSPWLLQFPCPNHARSHVAPRTWRSIRHLAYGRAKCECNCEFHRQSTRFEFVFGWNWKCGQASHTCVNKWRQQTATHLDTAQLWTLYSSIYFSHYVLPLKMVQILVSIFLSSLKYVKYFDFTLLCLPSQFHCFRPHSHPKETALSSTVFAMRYSSKAPAGDRLYRAFSFAKQTTSSGNKSQAQSVIYVAL